MNIQFTARHFKARSDLQEFAEQTVERLSTIYDGIISADVTLEIEPHGDGKIAEVGVRVYKEKLFAKEHSDDFKKSIVVCVDKLERQLRKYKGKLHEGRQPHEKQLTVEDVEEDDE